MTTSTCPRRFEVEALRDGRLAGVERSSFERHITSCAACSREAEALDRLGRTLLASSPADVDELHLRRERTRLLAAFDRNQVGQSRPWPGRRAFVAFSFTLALVVGAFMLWRLDPNTEDASATATDTAIHADSGTRWSRRTQGGRELVVLDQGSLWIRVRHAPGTAAFAVLLPDGELQDIGTTFSVAVRDGHTERVQVEEGTVLLKLRGRPPVALGAGQTWHASPVQVPVPASQPPLPLPPTPPPRAVAPSEPLRSQESASRPPPASATRTVSAPGLSARATSGGPAASSGSSRDASDEFRTALAAFNAGQTSDAARRFQRFAEQHPADPRAEDAAYLRVLALERAGDDAGRRAAARVYLSRYPAGFRRAEVERLGR